MEFGASGTPTASNLDAQRRRATSVGMIAAAGTPGREVMTCISFTLRIAAKGFAILPGTTAAEAQGPRQNQTGPPPGLVPPVSLDSWQLGESGDLAGAHQ